MDEPVDMLAVNSDALTSKGSIDPSSSMNNGDEDEDWVIVKQQRINILIPPPSPASPQAGSPKVRCEQTELRRSSSKRLDTSRRKHPKHLIGTKMKTQTLLKNGTDVNGKSTKSLASPSERTVPKDVTKMKSERCFHSPVAHIAKEAHTNGAGHAIRKPLHQHSAEATSSSRQFDRPRLPIVGSNVANRVMRARLLKKRLVGLGGLRNWLLSRGLGRFVQTLERENLGMYQLVGLTMSQLKDMGYLAVGPRRKLIHAIDNLCQPYHSAIWVEI